MPSSVEREYIVLRDMYRGAESTGLWSQRDVTPGPKPGAVQVTFETLNKKDTAELEQDPTVLGHAPPMEVRLVAPAARADSAIPAGGGASWGVTAVGALKSPYTGAGITVAVLDTGIDAQHEAFAGVELVQKDFTGEGAGDNNGHGTHCAGTILGRVRSGYRFGIAPGVQRALIGKVLDRHGSGSSGSIVKAILWALENGAQIISISIGLDFPGLVKRLVEVQGIPTDLATSMALEEYRANVRLFDSVSELIRAQAGLLGKEAIVVAAAGNESKRHIDPKYEIAVSPPANAVGFLSVGALEPTQQGKRFAVAYFSNTGPGISAPGVDILSAKAHGGYALMSGTSMATPHVAGVAALWAEWLLQKTGRIQADEIIAKLKGQAATDKLARRVDTVDVGAGLVQAPVD